MNNKLGSLLVLVLFISSCVTQSRYKKDTEGLQNEIEKIKTEKSAEKSALDSEISKLQSQLIAAAKDKGQLRASLDEMTKALEEMKQRKLEQEMRIKEFEELTQKFKKLTDAGALSVQFIDGKMVVSLGSDILFSSGSAKISSAGLETVKEVARQLKTIPNKKYQIEGHTDNMPIATAQFPSNWELASARALVVVKTMIEAGLPSTHLSAASFADTNPRESNDSAEGRAANRRIAIVVVPDLSTLPGYSELKNR